MALSELIQDVLRRDARTRGLYSHDPIYLPGGRGEDPGDFDSLLILDLLKHKVFDKGEILATCISASQRAEVYAHEDELSYWHKLYVQAVRFFDLEKQPLVNTHALWLRDILRDAWSATGTMEEIEFTGKNIGRSPRWKSGIEVIDRDMELYGMVAISGTEGVGKSRLMNQAAMLAAEDREGDESSGWDVIYLETENAANVINFRVQKYWNEPIDVIQKRLHRLRRWWVPNQSLTAEDVRDHIISMIQDDTRKFLIVIDSLHTLVDKLADSSAGGEGYFGYMKHFLMWLQDARVESGGMIGTMIAAELNKEGQPKGGKIGYTIDVGVRITEPKTEPGTVKIQVHKSRETKKPDGCSYMVENERFKPVSEFQKEHNPVGYVSTDSNPVEEFDDEPGLDSMFGPQDPRDPDGW